MGRKDIFVERYINDGFVAAKSGVLKELCNAARVRVHATLISNSQLALKELFGESNNDRRTALRTEYDGIGHYHSAVSATSSAEIQAVEAEVRTSVERLLGTGQAILTQLQITVAPPSVDNEVIHADRYHLDYLHRMVEQRTSYDFPPYAVIAGVNLSSFAPREGNLIVYPGGHFTVEQYIAQEGDSHGAFKALRFGDLKGLEFPKARKVIVGDVGDVVLMHPFMPHAIGVNYSSDLKVKLYCRYQSRKLVAARRTVRGLLG